MLRKLTFAVAALALTALPLASARADVVIGLRLPIFVHPYHHHHGPAVIIAPAPVVVGPTVYVQPAPVYVQPAPQVIQVPATQYVPAPYPGR